MTDADDILQGLLIGGLVSAVLGSLIYNFCYRRKKSEPTMKQSPSTENLNISDPQPNEEV